MGWATQRGPRPTSRLVSQASRNFTSCACALGRGAGEGKEKYVWALLPGFLVRVVCHLWAITPSVLGNVATAYRVPRSNKQYSVLHATAAESKGSQSAQEGSVARSRSLSSRPLPLAIVVSVTFYTQRLRNPFMLRGTRDRAQISRAAI